MVCLLATTPKTPRAVRVVVTSREQLDREVRAYLARGYFVGLRRHDGTVLKPGQMDRTFSAPTEFFE